MKFVNLKTCHGIESYLLLDGGLLRLSLVPEKLRHLSQEELAAVLASLKRNPAAEAAGSGKASTSAGTGSFGEPAQPAET